MTMPESTRQGPLPDGRMSSATVTSPGLPPEFAQRELASVRARRAALGIPLADTEPTGRVGLAISGGGIRSATFALGVLQALARHRRLRHVDYLSTVSGGGYIGAFLGSLYLPAEARDTDGEAAASPTAAPMLAATVQQVEDILADGDSPPLRWLREHGRYITPRGAGDILYAAAIYLRNWISLHYVLAVTVLALFLAANLLRAWLGTRVPELRGLEAWLFEADAGFWWSPWFALPLAGFILVLVPLGWAYWLTQTRQGSALRNPALAATGFVALCAAVALHRLPDEAGAATLAAGWLVHAPAAATVAWLAACAGRSGQGVARNRLSRWLAAGLATVLLLAAWAMVDSLGQTLFRLARTGDAFGWTTLVPLASAIALLVQRFAPAIERLAGPGGGLRVPASALLSLLGFLLLAIVLVGWSAVGHALLWTGACMDCGTAPAAPRMDLSTALLAVLVVIALLTGRTLPFLNLSTLAQFYSARLTRAYLGASHPGRTGYRGAATAASMSGNVTAARPCADVSQAAPGDEIRWRAYRPDLHGGPLHFVNVTVNETVIGAAQLAQRDRKGLPMTVGPFGLSVGRHDHARWDGSDARIVPLDAAARRAEPHAATAAAASAGRAVEPLGLGQWIAVSGAAFSTGLGARTRMGLSMLLALSNARLGYWWDSGVMPRGSSASGMRQSTERAFAWLAALAPVQMCLANETFARFHGARRRRWHLSDGGHFENTGVYELLRRRVPFMIVCDDGQDPGGAFEDLGNLVRKARIDWGAEIRFLSTAEITELVGAGSPLLASIGTPAQLKPGDTGHAERHAALAWAQYGDDPRARSLLLVLRPALLGDEPLDLREYAARHPDFPQQSTADQSFDEAQWESYRRLGEHIGERLFGTEAMAGCWAPQAMCAPSVVASSR
jgi:hypothetical protein